YCSSYYHVNTFRATYVGFIFLFDNEEDWGKVQPENHVDPPPLERNPGEPLVENVDNKEGEPQVNDIPITTRGGGRRGMDHNVNVHEVVNEPKVQEVVNDIPRETRGGGRRGRDHNVNVHEVVNEPEVQEVVNNIPRATRGGRAGGITGGRVGGRAGGTTGGIVGGRAGGRVGGTAGGITGGRAENQRRYSTRSAASRGGGRGLGWWLGEDSQPPSTPGQSTPCLVFSETLTQSQPN
ncbi:hypothetical protein IFM89_023212, partial [Coptis chinensis]